MTWGTAGDLTMPAMESHNPGASISMMMSRNGEIRRSFSFVEFVHCRPFWPLLSWVRWFGMVPRGPLEYPCPRSTLGSLLMRCCCLCAWCYQHYLLLRVSLENVVTGGAAGRTTTSGGLSGTSPMSSTVSRNPWRIAMADQRGPSDDGGTSSSRAVSIEEFQTLTQGVAA
ncbi:hypothetical protein Sjap_021204 [Stephania japonica]|uniref:Uncharacterized protein n=1 Tax=Stephania japonica TaxID=461633 RepID=A0AAP0I112_9MAGN